NNLIIMSTRQDKADKQKQKAKDMLGIDDDRAKEIFQEQPDRKQQKKKEIEEKKKQVDENE
ncbi:MAG: hypothetical protein BRC26_02805, partial [Nanohaloarchaea archaeon QH_8_44_6]